MKKNRKVLLGILCIMAFVLAGCVRMEQSIVVDENNKITMGSELAFNKAKTEERLAQEEGLSPEEVEEMMVESYEIKTIQGEEYYVQSQSTELTEAEMEENYPTYLITKDKFYFYGLMDENSESTGEEDDSMIGSMEDMGLTPEDMEYCVMRVKLPSEVIKTNGMIQEDKQSVLWDIKDVIFAETDASEMEFYAYTANDPGDPAADRKIVEDRMADPFASYHPVIESPTPSVAPSALPSVSPSVSPNYVAPSATPVQTAAPNKDKKAPIIKGVKKNKKYKNKVTLYVKDNVKVKKVLVNGKKVKLKKISKGKYKGYYKFVVKKKGKYTVAAYDTSGNCRKVKFRIQ